MMNLKKNQPKTNPKMKSVLKTFGVALAISLMAASTVGMMPDAQAASGQEINVRADQALEVFQKKIKGADKVMANAEGVLILPHVYKAGIGVGGEFGEGVLEVGGKPVDYYNMISASYGLQLGAQRKSILMFFMSDEALEKFQASSGWKAGVDASVAVINVGAEGTIDTTTLNKPIVAFVLDQKGLMYDLSLEGAKFTKIKK
ncbi:MAG: YSC84-related protein [Vampirovibrionales bacterium]|nr:YSC84-related protein [Vampirovibrionales bacterium]